MQRFISEHVLVAVSYLLLDTVLGKTEPEWQVVLKLICFLYTPGEYNVLGVGSFYSFDIVIHTCLMSACKNRHA